MPCSTVSPRTRCSHARSRTQLQCGLADADRLAGVDQQGPLDALLVEVCAVGRAEVLDVPLTGAVGQPRVPGAGEVVGEHERRVVGPADEDRLVAERDLRSGEGPGGDHEGARTLLAALAAGGGGPGGDGGPPAGAGPEEGGPPGTGSRG